MEVYRRLAAQRPDAFAEPLSTSLWVLADCLGETGNTMDAIETHEQALTTLAPLFERHVAALAPKIVAMTQEYLERCKQADHSPDTTLLQPIMDALPALDGN